MVNFLKNYFAGTLVLAAIIISSWAALMPNFFRAHDYLHGVRTAEMLTGLQEGQFPVRWSGNLGYGYGMPLFAFYAPLPSYVGAIIYWLGFDLIATTKILYLLTSVFTAIGAYKLGKMQYGRLGGVIVALSFLLFPYRAVNLFVRGALSEAWGMMALPWILYFIGGVMQGKIKAWAGLVISLVVLFLSHNLTTLMFVPFSILYVLVLVGSALSIDKTPKKTVIKRGILVLGSYLLATGISSFYLLTAFFEKGFTQVESILSGYFSYTQHFLYIRQFFTNNWGYGGSVWGPEDGISFFLGYGLLFGLAGVGLLSVKKLLEKRNKKLTSSTFLTVASLVLAGMALLLTTQKTEILWERIPYLSYVQFPWRFLAIAGLFASLALGSLNTLKGVGRYVVVWVVCFMLVLNGVFFKPEKFDADLSGLYTSDATAIRTHLSQILPDYLPKHLHPNITPATSLVLNQDLPVEIVVERFHEKLIRFETKQETEVILAVANYPGWMAELDGEKVAISMTEDGLIQVTVPTGSHQLGLRLNRTPIQQLADSTSLISLIVFIGVYLAYSRKIVSV